MVPTYRRPEQLRICLESLARLDYPRDCFEIVVVNDDVEGSPAELISKFDDRITVLLLTQNHRGPAAARNRGAEKAKGQFLAFTDDDCTPSPDWLTALAQRMAVSPDSLVGGRTINSLVDNPYSTSSQELIDYLRGYFGSSARPGLFFTTNNACVSAQRFRSIGGFDPSFPFSAEDREFSDRWRHEGNQLIYAPEAIVYHAHQSTLWTFCVQHFKYGRGAPHFRKVGLDQSRERVSVNPATFYLTMLRHPFAPETTSRPWLIAALLALSQVAYGIGVLWEKCLNRSALGGPARRCQDP